MFDKLSSKISPINVVNQCTAMGIFLITVALQELVLVSLLKGIPTKLRIFNSGYPF